MLSIVPPKGYISREKMLFVTLLSRRRLLIKSAGVAMVSYKKLLLQGFQIGGGAMLDPIIDLGTLGVVKAVEGAYQIACDAADTLDGWC